MTPASPWLLSMKELPPPSNPSPWLPPPSTLSPWRPLRTPLRLLPPRLSTLPLWRPPRLARKSARLSQALLMASPLPTPLIPPLPLMPLDSPTQGLDMDFPTSGRERDPGANHRLLSNCYLV